VKGKEGRKREGKYHAIANKLREGKTYPELSHFDQRIEL
jgi:hypothetical protein